MAHAQQAHRRRFDTVLVANRGEIAVRVIATLRRLGIRTVAVYSDADADSAHVAAADTAVRVGPAAATESYLSVERMLEAARTSGAQAVHPGYGFLSESAAFAEACDREGLVFIGPSAEAIASMGDKIRAKRTVEAAGVPLVPGSSSPGDSDERLAATALDVGLPVLFKPAAGGGGKGMRLVHSPDELEEAIAAARRESRAAFGDDTLFVERFVTRPRHIEVQVLGDSHGNVVHLGERECSLQRRHQKIVEEAPSPLLDPPTRERIGEAAVRAARAVGYVGAGTVEFIVSADAPEEFFFMEMNTRLQVEHPVTEMVTTVGRDGAEASGGERRDPPNGLDLVEWQVRVAEGEPLPFGQHELGTSGHAVEARIYAEDPARGFLPTGGEVLRVHEPSGPGVRVDSGVRAGDRIGSDYDPMLAKIVGWGRTRSEALRRLDDALSETVLLGVETNTTFLRALLEHPSVREGELDTGLVERELEGLLTGGPSAPPDHVLVTAALLRLSEVEPSGPRADPWESLLGWRMGGRAWLDWSFDVAGERVTVEVRGDSAHAEVRVRRESTSETSPHRARLFRRESTATVELDGHTRRYHYALAGRTVRLASAEGSWALTEHTLLSDAAERSGAADGAVTSPMPGTVLIDKVAPGQRVSAGQALFVVEAMKMEHTVTAPVDGLVTEVFVTAGQAVELEQPLAVVTAQDERPSGE
ncbi:acetyl/propionyl/methylcrotonyl-CoA carboxylase subunit alpha [Actinopolyspora mortivallis]|uniref:Biotin-dependent 3-methylcrotonyl-coenzyme A carboxylase alpha1 subunit n=1 Tax=Actinopolyspora mortivallis TaxID=33906 RepID=A0A2T0GRH5_ACTMO|nr:biotin carboxylase N-terminal domain-containing protein [Actinopolyspora mortivallis]PRW61704.1 acetyl/propionyl-CoA carboxylase subunit alpha [Actinopolyspora mortivallis]